MIRINAIPIICLLFLCNCSGAAEKNKVQTGKPSNNNDIYLRYDKGQKPVYIIPKCIVADSALRVRLGRALVSIYMGNKWWPEGENTFKEADSVGIKVLLEASNDIENDDGTAALVLRNLGPSGCDAMIDVLHKAVEEKGTINLNYIEELGNARYDKASSMFILILDNKSIMPEARVAAAVSLSQIGNYTGISALKKMREEKTSPSWKKWIDKNILIIENKKPK